MARDGSSDGDDKTLGWQKPWDQSYVLALESKTGRERWKGKRGLSRISHGVPTIWEHDDRAEVVTEAGDVLHDAAADCGYAARAREAEAAAFLDDVGDCSEFLAELGRIDCDRGNRAASAE